MATNAEVESILPENFRRVIEQNYYGRVNTNAALNQIATDQDFLEAPTRHVAFFSDHGVVHVRDVSQQILRVLSIVNGSLIPRRDKQRLEFMRGYGAMVAYLHDIGMRDFSSFGRAMHPEFAAQEVFRPEYDSLIEALWHENSGNVAWRLLNLADQTELEQHPREILREMLAMSICHSKSKVPMAVLNSRAKLRALMHTAVGTDLRHLFFQQRVEAATIKLAKAEETIASVAELNHLRRTLGQAQDGLETVLQASVADTCWIARLYKNFQTDSYRWLVSENEQVSQLVDDVCDTLRALRCADALRQRGTVLKTSAGYQIFVDFQTANCIHAFEDFGNEKMFLLETSDPIAAGEANLASSEVTQNGDLRIAFQRGSFAQPQAVQHAIRSAAVIINDIQADVISSFIRPDSDHAAVTKTAQQSQILIEVTDDNSEFAAQVAREIERQNPQLRGRCHVVPSLKNISDAERELYMSGDELDWSLEQRKHLLHQVAATGHRTTDIDLNRAFEHVRLIELPAGAVLLEAGSPPGFVYIPMGSGLRGTPLGGYQTFPLPPWVPLGTTSVIRGAPRNSTVVTEQNIPLLMIPKEIFLANWHTSYDIDEFREILDHVYGVQVTAR
jgi:hypothetical protein